MRDWDPRSLLSPIPMISAASSLLCFFWVPLTDRVKSGLLADGRRAGLYVVTWIGKTALLGNADLVGLHCVDEILG